MGKRLISVDGGRTGFSPFIDVAINGMAAMFVFLAVYVAVVPPRDDPIPPQPLRIVVDRLPQAVWFRGYQTAISASGGIGSYRFVIEPREEIERLHLFFDEHTGLLSGNPYPPSPADRYSSHSLSLHVTVTDEGHQRQEADCLLVIAPVAVPFDPEQTPLRMTTTTLPAAWVGRPYKYPLGLLGGIEPYTIEMEGLPPGLKLDPTSACIAGIPGPESVPMGQAERLYDIRIALHDTQSDFFPPQALRTPRVVRHLQVPVRRIRDIRAESVLPAGRAGQPYQGAIVASGGRGRLLWRLTKGDLNGLGLHLSDATGLIGGILSTEAVRDGRPAIAQFSVSVDDEDDKTPACESAFQIRILPPMHFRSVR